MKRLLIVATGIGLVLVGFIISEAHDFWALISAIMVFSGTIAIALAFMKGSWIGGLIGVLLVLLGFIIVKSQDIWAVVASSMVFIGTIIAYMALELGKDG